MREVAGMCWPHSGTVGHITVSTPTITGDFPAASGDDARVRCALVPAGKYRNGAARQWCRTHQHYWGVKADLAAFDASGERRCARHADPMGYLLNPHVIDMGHMDGAAIAPGQTVALAYDMTSGIFGAADIVQINLTPPALHAWTSAVKSGAQIGSVDCACCGHPHLDLDNFAQQAHRRHYCGNCGNDATHSKQAIVSHPIFALLHFYGARLRIVF